VLVYFGDISNFLGLGEGVFGFKSLLYAQQFAWYTQYACCEAQIYGNENRLLHCVSKKCVLKAC